MKLNSAAFDPAERRLLPAYSAAQVAAWLRLPPATVRAWAKGQMYTTAKGDRRMFEPVIKRPTSRRGGTLALSFVNLVELHVLSALRRLHGLSLPKIRRSLVYVRQHFPDVGHPLADLDLLTDGLDLWLRELNVLVAVSDEGQVGMREVLEAHLRRVDRGASGEALRLYPFTRPPTYGERPRAVVVDPELAFGRPVLSGTGIPTQIIATRFDAGESLESLSTDYVRPLNELEEAIRWERRAA